MFTVFNNKLNQNFMKLMTFSRIASAALLLGCFAMSSVSCQQQSVNEEGPLEKGTIDGTVRDDLMQPIADAVITVSGVEGTFKSAADGTFSISDVTVDKHLVTFAKSGYATVGMTVPKNRFVDKKVTLNPVLEFANAVIKGKVLDAQNGNAPFAGVNVSNGATTVVTGADGSYLFENLTISDYTLTFSKIGAATITRKLTKDLFVNGVIEVEEISMGGKELLRDLTAQDLKSAPKLYLNEYRGGYGRGGGRVDWSTVFMSAQWEFHGNWEMKNEGCTLRIRNDGKDRENPEDLQVFDTYMYGSKLITADNSTMTVYVRTHNADMSSPAYWGVQVIDLNSDDPAAQLVGEIRTHGDGSYSDYVFDLSDYVGKEVIVVIGIFRKQTGDYWKQLCIAHVSFATEAAERDEFLPGTEVSGLEGWHMTNEHVRSMMPNSRTSFTGLPSAGNDIQTHRNPAYRGWFGTGHIASEWGFMYVNKDVEPMAGEGFVIKVRSGARADYNLPESYFYSKFNISSANDRLVLKCRNFDGNTETYFRLTVITEDGVATALDPVSNNAASASKVADGNGCWKFIHNDGNSGNPAAYASFEYDLSAYTGQNVVVTVGVHKGVSPDQGGEQKLCIYSIELQ